MPNEFMRFDVNPRPTTSRLALIALWVPFENAN